MDVMTIDSLDGLRGPVEDFNRVSTGEDVFARFEDMAERGQLRPEIIDAVRDRLAALDEELIALTNDADLTNDVLERAASENPDAWRTYLTNATQLQTYVARLVETERKGSLMRSVGAFVLAAAIGGLITYNITS